MLVTPRALEDVKSNSNAHWNHWRAVQVVSLQECDIVLQGLREVIRNKFTSGFVVGYDDED